jgi:ribosome biogenesis GTPase
MPRIDIDAIADEWDQVEDLRIPRSRRGAGSYSQAARDRIERHDTGRVVGVDKGHVQVLFDGEEVTARYAGSMRGTQVAVGDVVRVRPPRHESDVARVVHRLERTTVLTRTGDDTDDDERVVVANADQVAVVVAADNLDAGVGFLDRVMVAASAGGLDAVVVVNRIDLAPAGADVGAVMRRYGGLGTAVHATDALRGTGIDGLERDLAGCWTAFAGHSGVGKTTLFNHLVPEAEREVGDLGPRGGRHTTTASRAMHVPALDAWLVDTPGVRSFGLGVVAPDELAAHFPELARLDCALEDCLHDGEPGCRLDDDVVDPSRLASYRRLLAGLRGQV